MAISKKKKRIAVAITIPVDQLGSELRRKRVNEGMNLKDVEEETGISASTLSRVERGRIPKVEDIKKLAEWLSVNVQAAGEEQSTIQSDEDLVRAIEVHLRARKNLSEQAARTIAKTVDAFMAWEVQKQRSQGDG